MSETQIRPATPEDADTLARVIDAAYAPFKPGLPGLPDVSSGIEADIADNIVLVAEDGGAVVGTMILVCEDDHIKLANIAVLPVASGQGIASALLERAQAEARQRGLNLLRLNTHVDMQSNVRFYARRGWVETGRSGVTVTMEKTI